MYNDANHRETHFKIMNELMTQKHKYKTPQVKSLFHFCSFEMKKVKGRLKTRL